MIFCLKMCIYMNNSLVVFWKSFLFLPRFLVKNARNNVFEDKWFLSKVFHQIKMQAATNRCSHLKKNIEHLNFFKRQIFSRNFQKSNFSEIFENHQKHTKKSLYEMNLM